MNIFEPVTQQSINETTSHNLMQQLRETYQKLDLLAAAQQAARTVLDAALLQAMQAGQLKQAEILPYTIEIPADVTHGDLAANLAMVNARSFGCAPRQIADAVIANINTDGLISRVEVAGPGFINLFLSDAYFAAVVMAACANGAQYGRTNTGNGKKVNVEFVSANPTGPMHLGNARGGALGDCLAAAMDWAGYNVTREFYINDAGNQIIKFGKSLAARYLQICYGEEAVEFPEDGYQGEDIRQRAAEFYQIHSTAYADKPLAETEQALIDYALPKNIQSLKDDLAKYRIEYDVWYHESTLHENQKVQQAVDTLLQRGAAYKQDGTIWYKATAYGAEKDEVLVRSNGIPTYFAADIAYHATKFERGAELAIDVWGADHHGHVARMKGALDAIGLDGSKLDIVLMQFVQLVREGQPVRMSKRSGKAITLTDLLEEVPIDSARFFFNMRDPASQIEFDLDLAVREDSDNPVYYVQYAHARICSLLNKLAEEEGIIFNEAQAFANLHLLVQPEERALIRKIAAFPGEIAGAAAAYDPARITRYVADAATGFHKFYTACRLKGEEEPLVQARLALVTAAKMVIANSLAMLKINAPEKM